MTSDSTIHPRDESRIDLILSWHMFRQNAKPFLITQGIALGAAMAIVVIITGILSLLGIVNFSGNTLQGDFSIGDIFLVFFQAPALLVFLAFQGSLYGLAFDVMSSGDQFAEIGGAFRYLGKFLGRYLLFGLILNIPSLCLVMIGVTLGAVALEHIIELVLVVTPIALIIFAIFVQAGPALTAQMNIRTAFKDNFQTLRTAPRRLIKTWALFWTIFYLPQFITDILVMTRINAFIQGDMIGIPILIVSIVTEVWYYLVGIPVQTLVATRIYNSLHIIPHNTRV